ncbi:MAG: hypothetical protein VKL39_17435 [Leptolyngbyaceae bacterium]|nr:hypothetical protein [Leptolyngbyaceae bacterium]
MNKATNRSNQKCVELADHVYVKTPIPVENHPALRAGFGGYTANPRWCGSKVMAWRTGKAWRTALREGKLVIRESDQMLVPFAEAHPVAQSSDAKKSNLFGRLKRQTMRIQENQQIQQA